MPEKEQVIIAAREDVDVVQDLKRLAEVRGTDLSALVRQAIREFLAREAKA